MVSPLFPTISFFHQTTEKKRHSEINNQIILSNVKYQQALNQSQSLVQRYVREKEESLHKEALSAAQEAELEALRLVNAKIMDLLARSLGDTHNNKPTKAAVTQLREENARSTPKEPWLAAPAKGLHVRTASESNSATYLAAVTKPISTKPTKPSKPANLHPHKPAPKVKEKENAPAKTSKSTEVDENNNNNSVNMSLDMSIEYDGDETKITPFQKTTNEKNNKNNKQENVLANKRKERKENSQQKSETNVKKQDEEIEDEQAGKKYGLRRTTGKNYAEPSLHAKLRRGDSHPNVIAEYVVRSYAAPIRAFSKENLQPDGED
eukprot:Phypoly_transcript_10627.p1 GENE.Phypoly_transcript_10627~~Phypoly_transcript_10627.p1  ORF type:complete len:322 (+),score=67.44 Phypoly_transcript_10627:248-1213(+)